MSGVRKIEWVLSESEYDLVMGALSMRLLSTYSDPELGQQIESISKSLEKRWEDAKYGSIR